MAETRSGQDIDLTRVDDEPVPVAKISQAPSTVNEGDTIDVEITLTPPFATTRGDINFARNGR